MWKHAALFCALEFFLVGGLLYSISPDEVRIAYIGIKRKLLSASGTSNRGTPQPLSNSPRRQLVPDPFGLYGLRRAGSRPRRWIGSTEMLGCLPGLGAVLWLGLFVRKRRFRFAVEKKMAVTLVNAVRQMSESPERTLSHDA